jgi:hypothetical protein
MIDHTDFSLPDEEGRPSVSTPGPATGEGSTEATVPAPVIVVEYRQRGLLSRLAPPLLILAAALVITSYQRKSPVRFPVSGSPVAVPRVESATAPVATTRPALTPTPESAAPATSTAAPTVPATRPAAEAVPAVVSPFELGPADGLRPLDPAPPAAPAARPPQSPIAARGASPVPAVAALPLASAPSPDADVQEKMADPPSPDSKEAILDDIQREAAEKENQRQSLEDLKPRARALLFAEFVAKIQAGRTPFRNELQQTLKTYGPNAGGEIDKLCNEFGREMPPEIKSAYYRAIRRTPQRMTRQAEIEFMRGCGLPEPVILDYLANKVHKTLNTRGGPRDENEVRVKAAQILLSVPVNTPHPSTTPDAPAPADSRPVARAASPPPADSEHQP